jgi:protein-tyrosine-phosphatase
VSDRFDDDLDRLLETRTLVQRVAAGLHREFAGVFGVETIERVVDGSYASLVHARVQAYVPLFVERYARERLRAVAKVEGKMTSDKPGVVFLCVHNAGRSQMAAGWLQHLAGDQVEVFSGGSNPGSQVNPSAVAAMAEVGIDIADAFPKQWTEEVLRAADVIITMGCGDACPIFPGKRYEDWSVPDPAGRPVEQVRPIRDEIADRVRKLMADLGLEPRA